MTDVEDPGPLAIGSDTPWSAVEGREFAVIQFTNFYAVTLQKAFGAYGIATVRLATGQAGEESLLAKLPVKHRDDYRVRNWLFHDSTPLAEGEDHEVVAEYGTRGWFGRFRPKLTNRVVAGGTWDARSEALSGKRDVEPAGDPLRVHHRGDSVDDL